MKAIIGVNFSRKLATSIFPKQSAIKIFRSKILLIYKISE